MAKLGKVRNTNKKTVKKMKIPKARKAPLLKKARVSAEKSISLESQETIIKQAKFSYPQAPAPSARHVTSELPSGYGDEKIILQVRDTRWLHSYWEIRQETFEKLRRELKDDFSKAKRMLRVYDISNIDFNGHNAHRYFDIEINDYANSWYIDTNGPGRSWCVDLGLLLPGGRFITIVRSNVVHTPLDGPSGITDEEWMIPDDLFARLYGLGFGLGRSSPVGKAWQERIKHVLSSGVTSGASPVIKKPGQRGFWLKVDCELIIYGATEPDAKVTVQNKEIKLRPDGTFSLRFAFPDGSRAIPVRATSSDKKEERMVTPKVSRETKTGNLLKT